MSKANKRKRMKYYLGAGIFIILTLFQLFILGQHLLNDAGWGQILKDVIWTVLLLLVTLGDYAIAKDVGTPDDDDERDNYIEMKTEHQLMKITMVLLWVLGAVFLAGGIILAKNSGVNTLVSALILVAIVLLTLWTLLIVIELILFAINYHRD
ncbi:hypothetical protein [Lactobacillus ultunensis]|nr:hypothetical protein [Lactobacillus ultunensis]QQP28444.1 hypothetical protein H4B44_10195 [Lactobacillus ultunensis]